MKIGSINENRDIEQRIAITPEVIKKYKSIGLEVCLSKNYGVHLGINDKVYENEGAVILKSEEEVISIGVLDPYSNKEKLKNINSFSLELLPRITRAQSMDILSSQANLAGYKAVIDSFAYFQKAIPMMMTAAGTISAAKVLVVGAGVAGLQAIATAKRMGAIVYATDVRSAS